MNELAKNLTQVFEQSALNQLAQYKADKTILGEVFSIVDITLGEYKIKYLDSIWSAFSKDKSTYKIGDAVLVKVPLGDFSSIKYIEGYAYNKDLELINNLSSYEILILPMWNRFYSISDEDWRQEFGLIAYEKGKEETCLSNPIFVMDESSPSFLQYSNLYTTFLISAEFSTCLIDTHFTGSYGLKFVFATQKGENITYCLDSTVFNGNPYTLSLFSLQSISLTVPTGYLTDLLEINFYLKDFDKADNENITVPNLFCKNIQIYWINHKDLTEVNYYLLIEAPQGTTFTKNLSLLTLKANLFQTGNSIFSTETCKCYWYILDASITTISDDYDKLGGCGWKKISTNPNIQIMLNNNITFSNYKLIVIYNSNITLSEKITIYNSLHLYSFEIQREENWLLINEKLNKEILFTVDWFVELPDKTYFQIGEKISKIDIESFLNYPYINIFAQIYINENKVDILSWTNYRDSEDEVDLNVRFIGQDVFHYDANGDIFDITELDKLVHTISYEIIAKNEDDLNGLLVIWLDSTMIKLTSSETTLENSMLSNVWIDENTNSLLFLINPKYYNIYNNNSIYLQITTVDGRNFIFEKEIVFLKDGDLGTNGTSYLCLIRPIISLNNKNKLSGIVGLDYSEETGWSSSPLAVKAFVYCNGERIDNNSDYIINYTWNTKNVRIEKPDETNPILCDSINLIGSNLGAMDTLISSASINENDLIIINNNLTLKNIGINTIYEPSFLALFYVKVEVGISFNQNKTTVYAYYPINIFISEKANYWDKTKLNILSPNIIQYSSSGENPIYDSRPLKFIYNNINYTEDISVLPLVARTYKTIAAKGEYSTNFLNSQTRIVQCDYTSLYTFIGYKLDTINFKFNDMGYWKITLTQDADFSSSFSSIDLEKLGIKLEGNINIDDSFIVIVKEAPKTEVDAETPVNLLFLTTLNKLKFLMPISMFNFDKDFIGALKFSIDDKNYIIFSIFMYLNTYGNEAINTWDGTSLVLNEDGDTILAPLIGAGIKNANTNTFTGVIMGQDKSQNKVGLYGYKNGINTFGLTENGEAYFGNLKQIYLDGNNAQITGARSGVDEGNYMTINLVLQGENTNAINVGDNFLVDYDGRLICTNADITGTHLKVGNNFEVFADSVSIPGYVTESDFNNFKSYVNIDATTGKISIGGPIGFKLILDSQAILFLNTSDQNLGSLTNTALEIELANVDKFLTLGDYYKIDTSNGLAFLFIGEN